MITAAEFLDLLDEFGFRHLTGVPCSYFTRVYERLHTDERFTYVPAVNEGTALAMATGMTLAGTGAALLVQNSGLGNLINPLTSLAMPYRVPVPIFMTMRGWPSADVEEPQHEVMGRATMPLLTALGVPHHILPGTPAEARDTLTRVRADLEAGSPSFVLIAGKLPGTAPAARPAAASGGTTRGDAIAELLRLLPDALCVSTTGYISRDLFHQGDRDQNLYLQGAMGHAVSVAAGLALCRPAHRVVVIDGDGSALMHLGSMSTVGRTAATNLVHVVLDNGAYESTGGQATTASTTSLPDVARACGYRHTISVGDVAELRAAAGMLTGPGPVLVHFRIAARSPVAGSRASGTVTVDQFARRFAARAQGVPHADSLARAAGNPAGLGSMGGR
jgi:phosphonopyruvate decarboxylase